MSHISRTRLFLVWALANTLGFCTLAALIFGAPSLMNIRSWLVPVLVISIPVSLAQWVALRRILPVSVLWVLTIPAGMAAAVLFYRNIPEIPWLQVDDESILMIAALYMVMGFTIGVPQWLLLRPKISGASIWLLGSTISLPAAIGLVLATDLVNQFEAIAYIVVALVYILITGLAFSHLLSRQNASQTPLESAL